MFEEMKSWLEKYIFINFILKDIQPDAMAVILYQLQINSVIQFLF